jgi:hypothetical protein
VLKSIGAELEKQFTFLFGKLNVKNTSEIIAKYIMPADIPLKIPESLRA